MSKNKKNKYQNAIDEIAENYFNSAGLENVSSPIAKGISLAVQDDNLVGIPQGREGHVIIFGGSGSGKSTGPIMATLRTWDDPLVATDPKGELYSYYKDLYEKGIVTRVPILFDPSSEDTVKYDPFRVLHQEGDDLMSNINALVNAISPIPPDCREPYWIRTKRDILSAGILYYYQLGLNFGETVTALVSIPLDETLKKFNDSPDIKIKEIIGSMAKLKSKELATHDRELRNELSLWVTNDKINNVFDCTWDKDENCICWNDLIDHAIFIRIPEERIDQWSAPLRIMITQLFEHLMRRPDKFTSNQDPPVLLLLDEIARYGKIEGMTNALCTLRSKNVNIVLAVQSLAQLDKHYGVEDRRIICDNCQHKVILQACDKETQEYLSALIGVRLEKLHSWGKSMDVSEDILGYTKQKSETYLPNVFPHKLSSLDEAILISPFGNYRLDKINVIYPWFEQMLETDLLSSNLIDHHF